MSSKVLVMEMSGPEELQVVQVQTRGGRVQEVPDDQLTADGGAGSREHATGSPN